MKKRDILFYLAVFVALAVSAATMAAIGRIDKLEGEVETLTIRVGEQCQRAEAAEASATVSKQIAVKLEETLDQRISEEVEAKIQLAEQVKSGAADKPAWTNAGTFRIYHYCPCYYCCGKRPGDANYGLTATGTVATEGRTVAVDPSVIPLGSEVLINGVAYIAEDTGVTGKTIDLFVMDHAQAAAMGTYTATVYWR